MRSENGVPSLTINPLDPPLLLRRIYDVEGTEGNWGALPNPRQEVSSCTSVRRAALEKRSLVLRPLSPLETPPIALEIASDLLHNLFRLAEPGFLPQWEPERFLEIKIKSG